MTGGIFLLLALIALFIGTRARRSNANMTEKAKRQQLKIKRFMLWGALILIVLVLIFFIPTLINSIVIAIDTSFSQDVFLGIALLLVGIFTIITIIQRLRKDT